MVPLGLEPVAQPLASRFWKATVWREVDHGCISGHERAPTSPLKDEPRTVERLNDYLLQMSSHWVPVLDPIDVPPFHEPRRRRWAQAPVSLHKLGTALGCALVDLTGTYGQLFGGLEVKGELDIARLVKPRRQREQRVGWVANRVLADDDFSVDNQMRVVSGVRMDAKVVEVDVFTVSWQTAWLAEF